MEDTADSDTVQWVVLKADSKLFFWQGGQGTEEMKRYPSRLISLFSRAYMLKVLVDIYLYLRTRRFIIAAFVIYYPSPLQVFLTVTDTT